MNQAVKNTPFIINATQHKPTQQQVDAGVYTSVDVSKFLNFESIPTKEEMRSAASNIANTVLTEHVLQCEANCIDPETQECRAMIGGAPFFMAILEAELKEHRIIPVYAFSERKSVEEVQPDGSVRKVSVFEHLGFIEA